MIFGIVGDIHVSNKQPKNRLDNYPKTQLRKIKYIFDVCRQKNVKYLLVPGDFFDHHSMPDNVKRKMIQLMFLYEINVICVSGQHDLRYHNSKIENAPIGIMDALPNFSVIRDGDPIEIDEVHIYGAGWGRDIPNILATNVTNILLTHRMIINKKKLWEAQEDYTRADFLLRTTDFNLIVSGDNHQSFTQHLKTKHLVNCGSLMRKNINQVDHGPCFYLWDSSTLELTKESIPIEPFEDVMNIVIAKKEKEENEKLKAFMDKIKNKSNVSGIDFPKNMVAYVTSNDLDFYTDEALTVIME